MLVQRVVAPIRRQVADQVRQAIIQTRFKPAQRLTERELAELTGVSRPTIREALQQLAAEGLVTTEPGKGWVVAALSRSEAEDLYAVRALIEGLAGRLFVERAPDEAVRELQDAVKVIEQTFGEDSDMAAMTAAKEHFYGILFAGTQSETIRSTIAGLHARVSILRARSLSYKGRPKESKKEIKAIIDCIVRRDADGAAVACSAHVESAARWAFAHFSVATG